MEDPILERRKRIETSLQTIEFRVWREYCDELRKTWCSYYNSNTPYISSNPCETCGDYSDCYPRNIPIVV